MAKENANEKELERQEKVAETVSKTDQFFRENKKTIYGCLIALLVIGLAIMAYYKLYYQPKSEEAARQMYPAEASFRDGEFDLALNGDGNTLGFAQIIDDYGTKGGKDIYLYAGECALNLGNYEDAIAYLKKYKGKDPILNARALSCIGDALINLEKFAEGAATLEKAAAVIDNDFTPNYLMKAAVAYEEMGDENKALAIYKKIKDQYPRSMEAYEIDKYIMRIESKQEAE